MKRITNSQGFTLIELIMVVVILGILAAVAIPRFINLQTNAQMAAEKGMAGGVRAGISIIRAAFLVGQSPQSQPATPNGTSNWPTALDSSGAFSGTFSGTGQTGLFSFVVDNGTVPSDNWIEPANASPYTYVGPYGNASNNGANTVKWYYCSPAGATPNSTCTTGGTTYNVGQFVCIASGTLACP